VFSSITRNEVFVIPATLISYGLIFLYNYSYSISYIKYIALANVQLTCFYRNACSKSTTLYSFDPYDGTRGC